MNFMVQICPVATGHICRRIVVRRQMKNYLYILKLPIIALVVNSVLLEFTSGNAFGPIIFNITRIVIAIWAGWLLVDKENVSIAAAAFSGPFLLFLDHVLIAGVGGLLTHDFSALQLDNPTTSAEAAYFMGIIGSYLMFFPISMLFSAFGGYSAKRRNG
ncbi:hypothetical protein [Thiolapillus brandeum]|nr:hypothetical protein [Thiolapillus brandeum]